MPAESSSPLARLSSRVDAASKNSSPDKYVAFLVERFAELGKITAKSMFGGYGFYCDGLFFAIYDRQHVYLKADALTMLSFEKRGLPAFQPFPDKPGTMKYFRAPAEMLEDSDALREWAGGAIAVALRAKKPVKRTAR